MDLLRTALRVLADEAVRGTTVEQADELALRAAADESERSLPIRALARMIINREIGSGQQE